jgi:hypothetical protein
LFTDILTGHEVNTGTWLSVTVTVNAHSVLFPLASVAVKTIFVVPTGKEDPLAGPLVWVKINPAQLSLAAGATQLTTALQLPGFDETVIFDGQDVKTGNSLSVTVTVNEQIAVLPTASVAVKAILVVPTGKAEPLTGPLVCITETPEQLSLTTGAGQLTIALHIPNALLTAMFAGQEIKTGSSLSITVTENAQVAILPLASVAENETLVTPTGKEDPLGKPVN